MDRTILHSDLNNCYASIELLHRPELRGKPIAVGGNVEARHGIILAKDYITKSFGVKTGEAIWQAKQKCPGLIVVPPNFDLYSRFFRRVRRIYGDYSDRVQPFGMDEAWVALSGTERLHGDGETVANLIRQRVKTELGLTVSIRLMQAAGHLTNRRQIWYFIHIAKTFPGVLFYCLNEAFLGSWHCISETFPQHCTSEKKENRENWT